MTPGRVACFLGSALVGLLAAGCNDGARPQPVDESAELHDAGAPSPDLCPWGGCECPAADQDHAETCLHLAGGATPPGDGGTCACRTVGSSCSYSIFEIQFSLACACDHQFHCAGAWSGVNGTVSCDRVDGGGPTPVLCTDGGS